MGGSEGERPGSYRIGTVAALTGVPSHTIRAWERRHRAIEPARTEGGSRIYYEAHVERLQLIKALVDCGEPIGRIASLEDAELRQRIARIAKLRGRGSTPGLAPRSRAIRLGALAPMLAERLGEAPAEAPRLRLVASASQLPELVPSLRRHPADALVLELERLGPDPGAGLAALREASGAGIVVVLYGFARRRHLERLARDGARLIQLPLPLRDLERVLLDTAWIGAARSAGGSSQDESAAAPAGKAPPRRFDDRQLGRLLELSSAVECECPNHLSSIVTRLVGFERYARDCANRSPADAALHARLARVTGEARHAMEELLATVCEHDRIEI